MYSDTEKHSASNEYIFKNLKVDIIDLLGQKLIFRSSKKVLHSSYYSTNFEKKHHIRNQCALFYRSAYSTKRLKRKKEFRIPEGTSSMKDRFVIEYKIKLQKMIEISQIIKTKTNLVIFKVIDSLFMVPSLLGNCFSKLLDVFSSSSVSR
jgi:hypothetical protein